jgi:hypothetical protein
VVTSAIDEQERSIAAQAKGLTLRHRRPYFAHGELTQRTFDALRVNGPVTIGSSVHDLLRPGRERPVSGGRLAVPLPTSR